MLNVQEGLHVSYDVNREGPWPPCWSHTPMSPGALLGPAPATHRDQKGQPSRKTTLPAGAQVAAPLVPSPPLPQLNQQQNSGLWLIFPLYLNYSPEKAGLVHLGLLFTKSKNAFSKIKGVCLGFFSVEIRYPSMAFVSTGAFPPSLCRWHFLGKGGPTYFYHIPPCSHSTSPNLL